jgi:hypothetical protein
MNHQLAKLGVLFLLTSCGGNAIEVGAGGRGTSGGTLPAPLNGPEDFPLPTWPAPDACVAQSTLPIVGTWNGYNGRFQNPVADFRVEILGASPIGGLCGTMTFKPGTTPPSPPTNYDRVYPEEPKYSFAAFPQPEPPIIDGFVFTIVNGRAQGTRAQLAVATRQPWQTWCEHQGSYPWQPNPVNSTGYSCLPNWAGGGTSDAYSDSCFLTNPDTNQDVTLNCGRWVLCNSEHVCACNAARCVADPSGGVGNGVGLELDFTDNEATGTVAGYGYSGPVLLERVPSNEP